MKRRVRKIANFFAFNFLFFALYLNFIHKDKVAMADQSASHQRTAAFSGTVKVDKPEKLMEKKNTVTASAITKEPASPKTEHETAAPLKLSIN